MNFNMFPLCFCILLVAVSYSRQDPITNNRLPTNIYDHRDDLDEKAIFLTDLPEVKSPIAEYDEEEGESLLLPESSQIESDAATKGQEMDKLIYELVQDEKKEAIQDQFENTALKAIALKSKLDARIDETMLALQNLRNLRRHIESAYAFANRFVHSQATSDQIKQYVVSQLDNSIQQVAQTLNYYRPKSGANLTQR